MGKSIIRSRNHWSDWWFTKLNYCIFYDTRYITLSFDKVGTFSFKQTCYNQTHPFKATVTYLTVTRLYVVVGKLLLCLPIRIPNSTLTISTTYACIFLLCQNVIIWWTITCNISVFLCSTIYLIAPQPNLLTWCQFHQHFTSSFCANIILPKEYNTVSTKKLLKTLLYEKASHHKMLVKLTPGQSFSLRAPLDSLSISQPQHI